MDLGLSGKTAMITGASRGLGRAMALALATEGVRLSLCARGADALNAAAAELKASANFLKKRISLLEKAYNTTLMTRHVDGIRLTPEGTLVLEAAKRMEDASFGLDRALHAPRP